MRRDDNPHVRDSLQLVNTRFFQSFQRTEIRRQPRRRGFAHFANTERIKESGKGCLFGSIQGINHILGRLRSHAIKTREFTRGQFEEICRRMNIFFLYQLIDNFVTHSVDVHRPTGNEVLQ